MPKTTLIVSADGPETRVAVIEDGLLGELYIERKRDLGIAGNIYKGKVERILPGMQAAFVNLGLEKSAYLHVSDVRGTPDDLSSLLAGGEAKHENQDDGGDTDVPDEADVEAAESAAAAESASEPDPDQSDESAAVSSGEMGVSVPAELAADVSAEVVSGLSSAEMPAEDASELVIIDASQVEKEPIARIHLPVRVPAGFHGSWIPDAS